MLKYILYSFNKPFLAQHDQSNNTIYYVMPMGIYYINIVI